MESIEVSGICKWQYGLQGVLGSELQDEGSSGANLAARNKLLFNGSCLNQPCGCIALLATSGDSCLCIRDRERPAQHCPIKSGV